MSRVQDALGVIRGLQAVAQAGIKLQEETFRQVWVNSSLRTLSQQMADQVKAGQVRDVKSTSTDVMQSMSEGVGRVSTVVTGIKQFATLATCQAVPMAAPATASIKEKTPSPTSNINSVASAKTSVRTNPPKAKPETSREYEIKLTAKDKELLKKLDMEHQRKLEEAREIERSRQMEKNQQLARARQLENDRQIEKDRQIERDRQFERERQLEKDKLEKDKLAEAQHQAQAQQGNAGKSTMGASSSQVHAQKQIPQIQVVPNPKSKLKLSSAAKQRAVPSSRIGRMVSFGTLAAGLGIGTMTEYTKRVIGIGETPSSSNLFLSPGNMDRIVDTLCKVRGAALKLGQILSIQDESFISPELARALERVRKSADFMPTWQVEKVMTAELGVSWRRLLEEFDDKPFAAASIGQVHWGRTHSGEEVAIKIQYPGVARGIESDIENLLGIMKVWNIFPKGMFVDNVADVAKRELAWEVDYLREAKCTRKFKELLQPYPEFFVPKVIDEVSSAQVFTTQLVDGIPVDQCTDLEQEERNFIAGKILELCLLELMEFQYMQTDPNWANFLYNRLTKQLVLLDFGASREYSKPFMDKYVKIIKAASEDDRETVLTSSRDIGFLTGYESKVMEEAHVDAVMILGEVFRHPGKFDFATQNTTAKIQHLVPTMIANRLCPPPEEIYSIHRKISGIFLLCLKLKASIDSQGIFNRIYNQYKFDS